METPNFKIKNEQMTDEQRLEAITKFFTENDIDKLTFDTEAEAKAHVDMINSKYGSISFVAEDRGGFAVKFEASHLGEGFPNNNADGSDLEKAA
ncbi:MAG: hypothetical protein QG580_320 [Patescibacteria group bacterium]|jgi:hypothetical protein|nr:hypothetical protein [Patescibacteria group bacterium]